MYDAASKLAPVSPARPETPAQWKPLISLPRPRKVYLPFGARIWAIVTAFFFAGAIHKVRDRLLHLTSHYNAIAHDLFPAAFLALGAWGGIGFLRREFLARSLLRDGEVTVGFVTGLVRRAVEGSNVSYQFWTRTGERFEHEGHFVSNKPVYSKKELVPVFYMPENPAKSVALCCVSSRAKLPKGKDLLQTKSLPLRP